MNKTNILFLTKDAFCKAYLPCYGNKYWKGKTPNLDELVDKGTIFNSFITAAPSSNMSYLSMFTMRYPYTLPIKRYEPLPDDFEFETLFDVMYQTGYEPHILWDEAWGRIDVAYSKCYGKHTTFHNMPDFRQPVGCKYPHDAFVRDNNRIKEGIDALRKELEGFANSETPVFLWCHLPHVLKGCVSYGSDIDIFDEYLSVFREYFDDSNIFISADHGNMNGLKGILCYGFHVYEPSINIPLITPKLEGLNECNIPVSNTNIREIILKRSIPKSDFVYSDSAYYAQENRKLAIVYKNYRYIYNKRTDTEELYDIEWDPNQNFNLISDNFDDPDRHASSPAIDYYFYPAWNKLAYIREIMREEKTRIWKEENSKDKKVNKIKRTIKKYAFLYNGMMNVRDFFKNSKKK